MRISHNCIRPLTKTVEQFVVEILKKLNFLDILPVNFLTVDSLTKTLSDRLQSLNKEQKCCVVILSETVTLLLRHDLNFATLYLLNCSMSCLCDPDQIKLSATTMALTVSLAAFTCLLKRYSQVIGFQCCVSQGSIWSEI